MNCEKQKDKNESRKETTITRIKISQMSKRKNANLTLEENTISVVLGE